LQASFSLLHDDGSPATPSRTKKRTPHGEIHFQKSKSPLKPASGVKLRSIQRKKQIGLSLHFFVLRFLTLRSLNPRLQISRLTIHYFIRHIQLQLMTLRALILRPTTPVHHRYRPPSPLRPLIKTFSHICRRGITPLWLVIQRLQEPLKVGMDPISMLDQRYTAYLLYV
jgi:hypothetical protein